MVLGPFFQVVDQSKVYTLEANSVSPKSPSSPSKKTPPNPKPSTITANTPLTIISNYENNNKDLETLHEKSNDDCINDLNDTCFDTTFSSQITNLDVTNSSINKRRKRKFISPDSSVLSVKRKRDFSYSERKARISNFFKTPMEYFSNRRRTISGFNNNQSMNDSFLSSSGIFEVEVVENLSRLDNSEITPNNAKARKSRKNLFKRTLSHARFGSNLKRSASRKSDLNASKCSIGDVSVFNDTSVCDGREEDNDYSLLPKFIQPLSVGDPFQHFNKGKTDVGPLALTHTAVLTSLSFYF